MRARAVRAIVRECPAGVTAATGAFVLRGRAR
jgi:hypothetical protein